MQESHRADQHRDESASVVLEQPRIAAPVKSRFFLNCAGDCRFLELDAGVLVGKNR